MTILDIDLNRRTGPKYRAIADSLAGQIAEGSLPPGTRLPPHRELAWKLGVTVGTVSRAYAEMTRRGLLNGEVGRGSFVRAEPVVEDIPHLRIHPGGLIDLSLNFPTPGAEREALAATLVAMAGDAATGALLDYQPEVGLERHRRAGARWIAAGERPVDPDRVVVTAGAQHAIMTVLATLTRPGDRIATEALSYQGIKPIVTQLGLRAEGLAMDQDGLLPDDFERAARDGNIRALYCLPTLHNPTTATMPETRRREIAAIAVRHEVPVLEDDIYRAFYEGIDLPSLAMLAGRFGYHITSMSKTVAPGLRTGYVIAPDDAMAERIGGTLRASCWMAPPLLAEVSARWIEDGTALRILENHRESAAARRVLARRILGNADYLVPAGSLHVWLNLPEPWRAGDFVAAMRDRGVAIAAAETFAIGRASAPHAVRICLGTPPRIEDLETGLSRIAEGLGNPTAPSVMQV